MVMTALSDEMNVKLVAFAKAHGASEAEVLSQALEKFLGEEPVKAPTEAEIDSYTLGLPYFGKYDLGDPDLSVTYKQRLREKLHEKYAH
jgi:hypothetical protein